MSFVKTLHDRSLLEPVTSIQNSSLVAGEAEAGTRYLLIDTEPDGGPSTRLVGGYASRIHVPEARWQMDVTGTLQALEDCNITLYGINTDLSASKTSQWDESLEFLSESQDSDVKCFFICGPRKAMAASASTAGQTTNRWGLRYGYAYKDDEPNCWFIESAYSASLSWSRAAAEMSALSLTYPNLIAFTVDDFQAHSWICGHWSGSEWGGGFTREDVRNIQAGARMHNPDFEFWPTHYVGDALKTAIPATAIGMTSGFPTLADEYIAATHAFKVPGLRAGTRATMYFLHQDDYDYDNVYGDRIAKTLYLNGEVVYAGVCGTDDRLETFEADVTSLIAPGANFITMNISSSLPVNEWTNRVWEVGDLRVIIEGSPGEEPVEYSVLNGAILPPTYNINGGVPLSASVLPWEEAGYSGSYIAETNEEYRYIDELRTTTMFYNNKTGTIQDRIPTILESYARCCPNTKIIHGQQGQLFGQSIPPLSIVEKFKLGSFATAGSLVWNHPIYLEMPTSGIFSERPNTYPGAPNDALWGLSASLQCTFPSDQIAVRAQYQRFITTGSYGPGEVCFRVGVEGGGGNYNYFATAFGPLGASSQSIDSITGENMYPAWESIADDPYYQVSGALNIRYPTEITASITSSTQLVFDTQTFKGYGTSYIQAFLSATVSSSQMGYQTLNRDDFVFSSGVTGSRLPDLYSSVKEYYATASSYSALYSNQIIERSADGAYWEFYVPKDGDKVFVNTDGETRTYRDGTGWIVEGSIIHDATIFSGAITAEAGLTRYGFVSVRRDASATLAWDGSSKTGNIEWDTFGRADASFYTAYSGSRSRIDILQSGDYQISYGINWHQTGSEPPIGLRAYIATRSMGDHALTDPARVLPSSTTYAVLTGDVGGPTMGTHAASLMASLKSTDALYLYVEHDFGFLPAETDTVAEQAWLVIEKV